MLLIINGERNKLAFFLKLDHHWLKWFSRYFNTNKPNEPNFMVWYTLKLHYITETSVSFSVWTLHLMLHRWICLSVIEEKLQFYFQINIRTAQRSLNLYITFLKQLLFSTASGEKKFDVMDIICHIYLRMVWYHKHHFHHFLLFQYIFALKFAIIWFRPLIDLTNALRLPAALYLLSAYGKSLWFFLYLLPTFF